jgi:hypothetical protein
MNLAYEDETFDAYTIAFGIRNVVRIDEVIVIKSHAIWPILLTSCVSWSSRL